MPGEIENHNADQALELAKTYYITTQEAIQSRSRTRDYALLSFVIASSPFFVVALQSNKLEILFCVPYLSLAFAAFVIRYDLAITKISYYCVCELGPYLRKNNTYPPQYDQSKTFHESTTGFSSCARFVSHLMLLELPSVVALCYTSNYALSSFPKDMCWWLGAGCVLIVFLALLIAHIKRWSLYQHKDWKWANSNNLLAK